jgi:hypothetical protein
MSYFQSVRNVLWNVNDDRQSLKLSFGYKVGNLLLVSKPLHVPGKSIIDNPIQLTIEPDLLRLVHNNQVQPLNIRKLFLCTCLESGLVWNTRFIRKLRYILNIWGASTYITSVGISGRFGIPVTKSKLIPCQFYFIKLINHLSDKRRRNFLSTLEMPRRLQ